MSTSKRNGTGSRVNDVSQKEVPLVDPPKLMLVPNAFVPQALQQQTEAQVDAIAVQMNEMKSKREELELQAQKEIDDVEARRADARLKHPPAPSSKLRRMWRARDALFERGDALEQLYFVYKLAASGLRWISPSELASVPEEDVMTVIEVLRGKAAYIDGYRQYATHDVRVVLQCIKSSAGEIHLLSGNA